MTEGTIPVEGKPDDSQVREELLASLTKGLLLTSRSLGSKILSF
jgi:hypothetical protein